MLKQLAVPIPHYRNKLTFSDDNLLGKRRSRDQCYMPLSQYTGNSYQTSGAGDGFGQRSSFALRMFPKSLKVATTPGATFFG